jgi:hypothetical protein
VTPMASRPRRRTLLAWVMIVATFGVPIATLAASPTTFADNFSDHSYNINDGLSDWSTDWIETGESDGPTKGNIQIDGRIPCAVGKCLDLKDNGGPTVSIARTADLSGFTTAVLTYTYQRHSHSGPGTGSVDLQVRANGGAWSTMRTYSYAIEDTAPRIEVVNISDFVSSDTAIRFAINGGGSSHHLMLDFFTISAGGSPPTTTLPPTTTTTTTQPPTTTMTLPPTTTTTTSTSPTTTTTDAAETTTTTSPTTTTTTEPTTDTVIAAAPSVGQSTTTTTTTTTIPLSTEEAAVVALNTPALDLGTRYVSVATGAVGDPGGTGAVDQTFLQVPAVGGLLAGFSTAVEGVAGSLIPSALLAVVVAWLSVQGLGSADRSRRRRKTG